jgi:hypothetical protein
MAIECTHLTKRITLEVRTVSVDDILIGGDSSPGTDDHDVPLKEAARVKKLREG